MAYNKPYTKRYTPRSTKGKVQYYAKRGYSRSMPYVKKFAGGYQSKGKNFSVMLPLTWIAGAVFGATDFDNKIPAVVKVGVATMPISGKWGGKAKQFAQGMCFGDLIQKQLLPMLGIKIGGNTGGASGNGVNQI